MPVMDSRKLVYREMEDGRSICRIIPDHLPTRGGRGREMVPEGAWNWRNTFSFVR